MNTFNIDLLRGKLGEQKFIEAFQHKGKIIDVSDKKEYQDIDVDFLYYKDDKELKIEVKTDYRASTTGNLFIEIVSSKYINSKGNLYKTLADVLLYYVPQTDTFYALNPLKVRQSANKFKKVFGGDNSVGILIPISKLKPLNLEGTCTE